MIPAFILPMLSLLVLPAACAPVPRADSPNETDHTEIPADPGDTALTRYEFRRVIMGVGSRIVLYARDEPAAREAARAAQREMIALDQALSDYIVDSEVSRLPARLSESPRAAISDELALAARLASTIRCATSGAFDERMGELTRLWRSARGRKTMPDPQAARRAWLRSRIRYSITRVEGEPPEIIADGPVSFDFGGIAKGLACDNAASALRTHGIDRFLVDMGGDLLAGNPPPGRNAWQITIESLDESTRVVQIANTAIATSGPTYQSLRVGSVQYSHIIDPRTGFPVQIPRTVTVLASRGAVADALASAISVLGPADAGSVCARFPDVQWQITQPDPTGSLTTTTSSGFSDLSR